MSILGGTKPNLTTTEGLAGLAEKSGFEKQTKTILQSGENPKLIFSGGFIQDIFDVANAPQSVIAGMAKNQGPLDAIMSRASFSDKDLLGKYGMVGFIGGIIADIATDPLMLIPPLGIGKRILQGTKWGAEMLKATKIGGLAADFLGKKLVYQFGQPEMYKMLAEDAIIKINKGWAGAIKIGKPINELSLAEQRMFTKTERIGGRLITVRKSAAELPPELLAKAEPAFAEFRNLGKRMVELGIIDEAQFTIHIDDYIANLYRKYELPKAGEKIKGLFGAKPIRVNQERLKARLKELPDEAREILEPIMELGYPLTKSLGQMNQMIVRTEFFNQVAERFSSNTFQKGMKQFSKAKGLFTTSQAEIIQNYKKLKNLNEELHPLINQLKKTFNADKKILSKIKKFEFAIEDTRKIQVDEFTAFFQGGKLMEKTISESRRLGTLPDRLSLIANEIKKFDSFDKLDISDIGLKLEKLELDGVLERAGFSTREKFFDYVKNPYKYSPLKTSETLLEGNIKKIVNLEKEIENLSDIFKKTKEIDKRSIDNSFRFLEKLINDIRFQKEEIITNINSLRLGTLQGKYIPEAIYNDIEEIFRAKEYGEKIAGKIMRGFKYGKVVMNPATHARNIISNFILNDFGELPLYRIPEYMTKAFSSFKAGGKYAKFGDEISELGVDASTFWGTEIKALLTNAGDPALIKLPKEIINKMGDLYQKEESLGKRMMYIFQREKGLEPLQAWAKAEESTFNYAKVTPFIRKLRESLFGMPFVTFSYLATPFVAKTLITHPARVGKYGFIKRGIENMSDPEKLRKEREAEPDYIKKGFYVRLPFEDQHGRAMYFDMTYILPFGDLISGNLFEGERTGEAPTTAVLRKFPLLNIVGELYTNQDFFGEPIVKAKSTDTLDIGRDIMFYALKSYGPPPFVDTPERLLTAAKVSKMTAAERGSKRTITEEILRNFGMKVKPFVLKQEQARREREKKTQLQTLLEQEGVVREFKVPYVPKK